MATSGNRYFAVKVFLPRVSEKKAFALAQIGSVKNGVTKNSPSLTTDTTSGAQFLSVDTTSGSQFLSVDTTSGLLLKTGTTGAGPTTDTTSGAPSLGSISEKQQKGNNIAVGVEGHLGASFLQFTAKENAACKNLAEAEKLVERKHKDWLVDAYDWFVTVIAGPAAPAAKATGKKPARAAAKTKAKAKAKPVAKAVKKKNAK